MAGDHAFIGSQSALFSASLLPPQCLAARARTRGQCVAGFIQSWSGVRCGDQRGGTKGFRVLAKMVLDDRVWPRRGMWERRTAQDRMDEREGSRGLRAKKGLGVGTAKAQSWQTKSWSRVGCLRECFSR